MKKAFVLFAVMVCVTTAMVWQMKAASAAKANETAEAMVNAYTGAWGEADDAARLALLEKAWADDGRYCDPSADVNGRDELVAHIGSFLKNPTMKGFALERTSGVDVHHNVLRFSWVLKDPSGKVVTEGMDFGVLAEDGRLQSITGFFGPFPETE